MSVFSQNFVKLYHILLNLKLLYTTSFVLKVSGQIANQFIYDCNDPLIVRHQIRDGDSYCSHACRPNPAEYAMCAPDGTCLCKQDCYSGIMAPPNTLTPIRGVDYCPPPATEPVDPKAGATATCENSCATACPGGYGGTICTDRSLTQGRTYARICTCLCPQQPCVQIIINNSPLVELKRKLRIFFGALLIAFSKIGKTYLLNVFLILLWTIEKLFLLNMLLIFSWRMILDEFDNSNINFATNVYITSTDNM